jgi:hypothetical protein
VAQHHVADGAAAQGGDEGDHDHAKDVHVAPACRQCAGHGFGRDGDQVDHQHDGEIGQLERVQQGNGWKHGGPYVKKPGMDAVHGLVRLSRCPLYLRVACAQPGAAALALR